MTGNPFTRRTLLEAAAVLAAATAVTATTPPRAALGAPTMSSPFVNVKDYGARGDGATDDAQAFRNAMAASKWVTVPPGVYITRSALTIPDGVKLLGGGKYNTILSKAFNGDHVVMRTESAFQGVRCEGNGSTYTGRGIVIPEGTARQELDSVSVTNTRSYCLDFDGPNAGSQFRGALLDFRRVGAATGSGLYQIRISPTQQLAAVPRMFAMVESNGQPSFDLGGCNNVQIALSAIGDLRYTMDTRDVNITASRILNQAALAMMGHGNTITGCDIRPRITIKAGSTWCTVTGNSHNLDNPVVKEAGLSPTCTVIHSGRFW